MAFPQAAAFRVMLRSAQEPGRSGRNEVGRTQVHPQELADRQDAARASARRISRDGGVLRETRLLSVLIAPFLVLGFGILYLLPGHTRDLFAWTIKPQMTAMMLGAAYLGGVYFFLRAATTPSWVSVQAGFPPVAVFATLLRRTTFLHWHL